MRAFDLETVLSVKREPKVRWPSFDANAIRRVTQVLKSGRVNYWTGENGRQFETMFGKWIGVKYALAVSSGTAALHLALEALGIGPGNEVICTPYSFVASSSCVRNAGARPVYVDVGADHMIDPKRIEAAITPRTRAIVVVHLYGQVADMRPILRIAREHRLWVVEDCAQCLGGVYCGRKVGTLGDVGCFSFCQNKHLTTGGEGGMVVTNRSSVATQMASLRDHGWRVGSRPKVYDCPGYNFRMTELQSAIGIAEMERLETWNLPRRKALAHAFIEQMRASGILSKLVRVWPLDTADREASFWLVPFVLDSKRLKVPVSEFIEAVEKRGEGVYRILWPLPVHRPMSADLIADTMGVWVHPVLTKKDVARTIQMLEAVATRLTKQA